MSIRSILRSAFPLELSLDRFRTCVTRKRCKSAFGKGLKIKEAKYRVTRPKQVRVPLTEVLLWLFSCFSVVCDWLYLWFLVYVVNVYGLNAYCLDCFAWLRAAQGNQEVMTWLSEWLGFHHPGSLRRAWKYTLAPLALAAFFSVF